MSEEKVLTLRGKKAVWAPSPTGGGGGVFVVKVDENLVASTGVVEIAEAVTAGKQVVLIDDSDGQNIYYIPLVLSTGGMAIFSAALSMMGNPMLATYTITYPSTTMERTVSKLAISDT